MSQAHVANGHYFFQTTDGPLVVTATIWLRCGWLLILMLPGLSGCGYIAWPETFGEVVGNNSTRSFNGLGVYRRMWETSGARVLTPKKLSPRLANIDAIVLVGSTYQPPGALARDWLEKWLGEKAGRTLVYFGRDFDAGQMYRAETLGEVAKADFERARDQLASSRASQYMLRNSEIPEDTFCRWFFLRTTAEPREYTSFTGPWSPAVAGAEGKWPVGVLLEAPHAAQQNLKPSWITGTKPALAPVNPFVKGADATEELGEKEIQRSIWRSDELDDAAAWDSEWELAGQAEVLLAGQDGASLVYRISHASFPGSQILIVVNGAPFLNGSLVKPLHRRVSEQIIRECMPAKRVAMIEYDQSGLLISNIESGGEANLGMELLTLWPLSAITMHAAFLGIIAFVVLLPILGRPQTLAPRSVTDFGLHVDALGRMLFEARDLQYGLKSISEYFRKVRRESPPDWLLQMSALEATAAAEKEAARSAKAARKPKAESASSEPPVEPTAPEQSTSRVQPAVAPGSETVASGVPVESKAATMVIELPQDPAARDRASQDPAVTAGGKPTNASASDPVS